MNFLPFSAMAITGLIVSSVPVAPAQGYFSNLGLEPLSGGAASSLLNSEPAAVLIFSGNAGSADATALFNTWATKTTRPFKGPIFGVAYKPASHPREIFEEVLTQRGLQFPIFITETDLLGGREYRLLVTRDAKTIDIPGLDFAALDAELAGQRTPAATAFPTVQASPTPPPPTPVPATPPTATPATAEVAPTATPVAGVPTPTPEPLDGVPQAGRYFNTRYGLTVEFPRGWSYKESRNADGAIGRTTNEQLSADLRVWAVPASGDDAVGGDPVPSDPAEYLQQHLDLLAEQTGSRITIRQRYRVRDEGHNGLDYTYTFSRRAAEGSGSAVPWRGRIQVFESDGIVKVVSAEAPVEAFTTLGPQIEQFIQSFHPFIADDQGNPVAAPAGSTSRAE